MQQAMANSTNVTIYLNGSILNVTDYYNKSDIYNRTEVYTKAEIDAMIANNTILLRQESDNKTRTLRDNMIADQANMSSGYYSTSSKPDDTIPLWAWFLGIIAIVGFVGVLGYFKTIEKRTRKDEPKAIAAIRPPIRPKPRPSQIARPTQSAPVKQQQHEEQQPAQTEQQDISDPYNYDAEIEEEPESY
jgi:hypothetical protein